VAQFVLVNGRPVRDRMLLAALRAGYGDLIPRDRHPAAVLSLVCDPRQVDVNVHPAKAEVRFREPGVVRGLVVAALRHALAEAGHRTAASLAEGALGAAVRGGQGRARGDWTPRFPPSAAARDAAARAMAPAPLPGLAEAAPGFFPALPAVPAPEPAPEPAEPAPEPAPGQPLGRARAQVFGTWIVAESAEGLVLVDAHAAHERIVYERLKAQVAARGVAVQTLLVPEIVECGPADAARLLDHAPDLAALGLVIEPFGGSAVAVRGVPALLGAGSVAPMLADIADELADLGASGRLSGRIDAVLSRMACHGSVRAGRAMRPEEMDALLRTLEATPNSGQCNHGRPTCVTLRLPDIERLFGRR
jgi:DNA mismatch repair protein MutL